MSSNKRLRRLLRNLIADKSWIEIRDWKWTTIFGEVKPEPTVTVIPLDEDYCWYTLRRTKVSKPFSSFLSTECCEHITLGASDCCCYNMVIEDGYSLIRLEGKCEYELRYKDHTIRIRRLSEREYNLCVQGVNYD